MDVKLPSKFLHSTNSFYATQHGSMSQHSLCMSKPLFVDCYAAKIELTHRPNLQRNQSMSQFHDTGRKTNGVGMNRSPVHFLLPTPLQQNQIKYFSSPTMHRNATIFEGSTIAEKNNPNSPNNRQNLKPIVSLQNIGRSYSTAPNMGEMQKTKSVTRKKSAKRPKSGKNKNKRKSNSSKGNNRKAKKTATIPVKKDLSSCFSLYSNNMSRTDQPKIDISNTALTVDKYNIKKIPQCKSATEPRRANIRLPPQATNCLSLSATTETRSGLNVEKYSRHLSLPDGGDVGPDNQGDTLQPAERPPLETIDTSVNLPLPPTAVLLSDGNVKPIVKRFTAPRQGQREKVTGRDLQRLTAENSLSSRLSLIHHYGTDYHVVTQRAAELKRRALARREHRTRESEKEIAEKQKQEQRKKIYALNYLMTNLEMESFKEFYKSIHGTSK